MASKAGRPEADASDAKIYQKSPHIGIKKLPGRALPGKDDRFPRGSTRGKVESQFEVADSDKIAVIYLYLVNFLSVQAGSMAAVEVFKEV